MVHTRHAHPLSSLKLVTSYRTGYEHLLRVMPISAQRDRCDAVIDPWD